MSEEVELQPTGIEGLDTIMNGGIPNGHTVLLAGTAGTGKTILSLQWLFEGAGQGEPGIYLAATEPITKALDNVSTMGFHDQEALDSDTLHFHDLRTMVDLLDGGDVDQEAVDELVEEIEELVEETGAKRLVLDSVSALGYMVDDTELFRRFIFRLGTALDSLDCTVFLTSEAGEGSNYTVFGIEDYISDGLISLENVPGEQSMIRHMNVMKMRGVDYRTGSVNFDISSEGISVYPKLKAYRDTADTEFETRHSTGIEALDEMTGGGYPEGHVVLMAGNTGTGKTTFGLRFLLEGLENGESVVFVNLEESISGIRKTAREHGWDLDEYVEDGSLRFVTPDIIDTYPDKMLQTIADVVEETGAERLVFDSVSSLQSATLEMDDVRQFLLQLRSFVLENGVTVLMTYLSSHMFRAGSGSVLGGGKTNQLRLSSLTDGIILLRYLEQEDEVGKVINVLKLRGSDHDRSIRTFEITEGGINIGEPVEERGG